MCARIATKTLEDLGWDKLIEHLVRRTHTARGAAAAAVLPFFDQPEAAEARIAEIAEARLLASLDAAMPFGGIRDVVTAIERAGKGGMLEAEDLIAVASTAAGLGRLRRHLDQRAGDAPRLAQIAFDIPDLPQVYKPILDSFDSDGRLADHASPELGPLRRKVAQVTSQIEQRIRSFVDDGSHASALQDRYFTMREDRYVVPVRLEARTQIRGIIHGTSQSGRTLFVEPEAVVELQNRLKLAQCDVEDEERRIFTELSQRVAQVDGPLLSGIAAATTLDLIDAGARLADELVAAAPIIDSDPHGDRGGRLSLSFARHPLMLLSERHCVANDIVLEPRTIMILSGPNAGGKTVALKTTGLAALMVRAGLHIPAEPGSIVPWFTTIHSDIGDAQSLENDLSTFTGHVLKLREYLADAGPETLLLIDEIAVGTEPEQGAALAQAVLEALADRGCAAIVTTHYERLKALGASDSRFANASVGFDLERLEPTFRLHLGVPGSSGALIVARRMGLDAGVMEQAEALLGKRRASFEELLAAVSEERRKLEEERAALAVAREQAERARREADAARAALRERERKLLEGAHGEAVAALRLAREELDNLRAELKRQARSEDRAEARGSNPPDLAKTKARIADLAAAVTENAPRRPAPEGARPAIDQLAPGTPVFVASLGGHGQVVEPPQRGRVMVQIGTMRTTVSVADVLIGTQAPGQGKQPKAPSWGQTGQAGQTGKPGKTAASGKASGRDPGGGDALPAAASPANRPVIRTDDITVDVRGERAEEAVSAVDHFIDQCLRSARDVVFVIHGHGTGALRSAIRSHLQGHHAVSHWRPGERSEGGDGVTIAWLDGA